MSKVNKVHSINNSYYAQQSRARHIHQEKHLEKLLKKSKYNNLKHASNLEKTKSYNSFLTAVLDGLKKFIKKLR